MMTASDGDQAIAPFPAVGGGADDRLTADAGATGSDLRLPALDEQQVRRTPGEGARFPEDDVNRPAACPRAPREGRHLRRVDDVGMSVCGGLWVGLVPVLPGSRCPHTVVGGTRQTRGGP